MNSVSHIFNYFNVKSKCIPDKFVFDYLEHPTYIWPIKSAFMKKKDWMDL